MSKIKRKFKYLFYTIKNIGKEANYSYKIETGRINEVKRELIEKLEKKSNDYSTLLLLKNIYIKENNITEFKKVYNKIITHEYTISDNIKEKYLLEYISFLFHNKKYNEIINSLNKKNILNNFKLLYYLIDSYYYSKITDKFKHITELSNDIEKLIPRDDYLIFEKLGFAHEKIGDNTKAKEYYSKALKINPESRVKENLDKM